MDDVRLIQAEGCACKARDRAVILDRRVAERADYSLHLLRVDAARPAEDAADRHWRQPGLGRELGLQHPTVCKAGLYPRNQQLTPP